MQRKIIRRKVVEAYEPNDKWKTPHVEPERLPELEELDLDEPKYNIGVMFYNDDVVTVEIVAYDKATNEEVGRLLCRNIEDINAFMSGAYCHFAETTRQKGRVVIYA